MDICHCVPQFPSTFCWSFFLSYFGKCVIGEFRSCVKKGYISDNYVHFFVRRSIKRSPIINRGINSSYPLTSLHYHSLHFSRNLPCFGRFKNLLVVNARSIYKTVFRSCWSRVCELKSLRQNIWPFYLIIWSYGGHLFSWVLLERRMVRKNKFNFIQEIVTFRLVFLTIS